MEIDEGRRLQMVERLHHALGADVTDTLLSYLPPGGWGEVATRGDLAQMRGEIAELRADLREDMASLRVSISKDIRSTTLTFMGLFTAYAGVVISAVHFLR